MEEKAAWAKVGELGLDKLVANNDPWNVTFEELAEKYLAKYPFSKQSTKDLYEQVIRNVLMPKWADAIAISIKSSRLKSAAPITRTPRKNRNELRSTITPSVWFPVAPEMVRVPVRVGVTLQ